MLGKLDVLRKVLNVLVMPMDASLACGALFFAIRAKCGSEEDIRKEDGNG